MNNKEELKVEKTQEKNKKNPELKKEVKKEVKLKKEKKEEEIKPKEEEIKPKEEGDNVCFVICNKQFYARKGTILYTDYINDKKPGDSITSDKILIFNDTFGTPYLPNAKVECKILKHGKKKKVYNVKFIPQKRHKRWKNYRTQYTKLEVTNISWQQ